MKKEPNQTAAVPRIALSIAEAADAAGLSRSKFYELLDDGQGPATFYLGRRRLVHVDSLDSWIRRLEEEQGSDGGHP